MSTKNKTPLYKVVTNNLRSVVMSRNRIAAFTLQYSTTEFVGGVDGSKVFCFSSLEQARDFRDMQFFSNNEGQIYEVETKGARFEPERIAAQYLNELLHFWKVRNFKNNYAGYTRRAINGTVLVDSVRLAKRVS